MLKPEEILLAVAKFITIHGGSMNYEEYINQNLWAQVEEVSIDNITRLDQQLTKMGISVDPNDLEDILDLIKEKVIKTVDN